MNENRNTEEQPRPSAEATTWQTPDYEVVETALEVTAYFSPTSR